MDLRSSRKGIPALPCAHSTITVDFPTDSRYPIELKTHGDHIRWRRLDLGLLQREVAERLGVSEASVWQWERSRTTPPPRYIPRIYDFLGYCPWEPASGFPAMLRRHRMAAGLTQEQLGVEAKIDESTLAKWERGHTAPLAATRERLDRFFTNLRLGYRRE